MAVTVTVLVVDTATHEPEAGMVYVIVAVPAATPDMTPVEALTVAMPVFPELQVPPASPLLVKVVVPATQIA